MVSTLRCLAPFRPVSCFLADQMQTGIPMRHSRIMPDMGGSAFDFRCLFPRHDRKTRAGSAGADFEFHFVPGHRIAFVYEAESLDTYLHDRVVWIDMRLEFGDIVGQRHAFSVGIAT
jgi:hypothetical protein